MRNKFLLSISICGVLILHTASSSGQEESPGLSNPETLDPVVVTGTAYPSELSKSVKPPESGPGFKLDFHSMSLTQKLYRAK